MSTSNAAIKFNESNNSGVYANCKNKNQLALAIWEQHDGKTSPKEVVVIASQVRPDIEGFILADAYNGQSNWRKKHGIAVTSKKQQKKTPATPATATTKKPVNNATPYEAAFSFVETCKGVDNAIAILKQLKSLKNIL